jgi:exopolyphosphatase/guanosine-5'-triphosphate,3'-diphosphate pyrophosphatase
VLQVGSILVSHANLRDGLLKEMVDRDIWTDDFRQQIVNSAMELGRKYHFDEEHAVHVAMLSSQLFDGTRGDHRLDARHRLLLYVAALLHEIGAFVSNTSLHKHSMYLITNSELFGLSQEDELLVGLIARYHRRASPKPTHQGYNMLSREGRVTVAKLASLLRLAIALNTGRNQRVTKVTCKREGSKLVLLADNLDDVTLEQISLKPASGLFEEVFGLKVELRGVQSAELRPSPTRL